MATSIWCSSSPPAADRRFRAIATPVVPCSERHPTFASTPVLRSAIPASSAWTARASCGPGPDATGARRWPAFLKMPPQVPRSGRPHCFHYGSNNARRASAERRKGASAHVAPGTRPSFQSNGRRSCRLAIPGEPARLVIVPPDGRQTSATCAGCTLARKRYAGPRMSLFFQRVAWRVWRRRSFHRLLADLAAKRSMLTRSGVPPAVAVLTEIES